MARLLFVSHTTRLEAGTSQSLLLLLKYLHSSHNVAVASICEDGELPTLLKRRGIPFYSLRLRTWVFLPQLILLILTRRFDLVYGNNFSGRVRLALWAAKLARRPFVWHIRESLGKHSNVYWLRFADAIVANSQDTARRISRLLPYKEVIVVPNGIEPDDFRMDRRQRKLRLCDALGLPVDSTIIINVGTVCIRKNQMHSVEAASRFLRKHPLCFLVFLGAWQDEDYLKQLKQRALQLGIENKMFLVGFRNNIGDYFCGADILLHTAQKEPQGRVILEAMASGLPVVTYNVGGVGEAHIDGVTGFLIPFGNLAGLAESLDRLIADPALRQQMGAQGYQRVNKLFTAEKTAQKIDSVIKQVLQKIN